MQQEETKPRAGALARTLTSHAVAAAAGAAWIWAADRIVARTVPPQPVPLAAGDSFALLGGHALIAVAACLGLLALAALAWLPGRIAPRLGPRWRAAAAGAIVAALAAWPAVALSARVVAGEWVHAQTWAPYLRWGIVVAAVVGAFAVGWLLFGWAPRSARRRLVLAGGALGVSVAATVADALVLPGLYPEAHFALYLASVLAAVAAFLRLADVVLPDRTAWRLAAVGVAVALVTAGVLAWRSLDVAGRAAVALASPNAAFTLRHSAAPEAGGHLRRALLRVDVDAGTLAPAPDRASVAALTKGRRDWNVVVIVMDALRADVVPPARREGSIGQDGDTPFLDAWLATTYRFRHVYTPASATTLAMPAIFAAQDARGGAKTGGVPIAERFRELGLEPAVVVPQWFLLPVKDSARPLLEGFAHAGFIHEDRQSELPKVVAEVLRDVPRPLFAWIHVYTMHEPYYAGRLLDWGKDARTRYREALRWTDGHLKELFGVLADAGLMGDDTIVVFTADHGETFGEHRKTGHGATVFEEDVRVPLAIFIPGTPGAVLDQTVGSVDILPTLVELLGGTFEPGAAGRSLVPLLAAPETPWPRAYTLSSGHRIARGVVRDRTKLIFDHRPNSFFLFDLDADPDELESVLGRDLPVEAPLHEEYALRHVDLVGEELKQPLVRDLAARKLTSADRKAPGEAVAALLRLVAAQPAPETIAAVETLFTTTESPGARLLAAKTLGKVAPARADALIAAHLTGLAADPAAEAAFVDGLRRQDQPPFAGTVAREGLARAVAANDRARLRPWLALVLPWPKKLAEWAPALADAAAALREDPAGLRLVALNVAGLEGPPPPSGVAGRLGAALAPHVTAPDPSLAAAAIAALGQLRHRPAAAELRRLAASGDGPALVRQALLRAIARTDGAAATDTIVALGADPLLSLDAVDALRAQKDPRALPYLDKTARTHVMGHIRRAAKAGADEIRKAEERRAAARRTSPAAPRQPN